MSRRLLGVTAENLKHRSVDPRRRQQIQPRTFLIEVNSFIGTNT